MLICKECGNVFSEDDAATVHDHVGFCGNAPAYIEETVCPACGGDDIGEAKVCDICGEYADADEMYLTATYRLCENCKEAVIAKYIAWTDEITAQFKERFSETEREVIEELQMDGVLE